MSTAVSLGAPGRAANLSSVQSVAAAGLLLRAALGAMWLTHSIVLKLMTFGIAGFAQWLGSVGIAPALAWPLVIAEIVGGVAILLGIHGRWASIALLPVLIGATAIHAGNGWVFSNANGGWEYPLFLLAASVAHILLGDGAFALKRSAR
jgi:putative oxidoreductase